MQARLLWLTGLAAVSLTGCQSYHPYGYAGTGPYPSPPPGNFAPPPAGYPTQGTYLPPPQGSPQTYSQAPRGYMAPVQRGPVQTYVPQGQTYAPAGTISSNPSSRPGVTAQPTSVTTTPVQSKEQPVPDPVEPRAIPESTGGALLDEDADTIKGSSRESGASRPLRNPTGRFADDEEEVAETMGSDDFPPPRSPIRRASGVADSSRGGRKSPYRRGPGYRMLSGTLSQDPQTREWQLTYDPDGNDEYGGTITLSHDEALEHLVEGDAVMIHGRIDTRNPDRFGRPRYRPDADRVKLLVDQEDSIR